MHNHQHNHHDDHSNIKVPAIINTVFTVVEFTVAMYTNSVAVLSKGIHDLGDSVALILSWFAEKKAKQDPDKKRSFGYKRISTFSALLLALVLFIGSVFILVKTIPRLINPEPVKAAGIIGVGVLGVLFNGTAFYRAKKGEGLNSEVVSWHLLEDFFGWSTILVGAIVMYFFNYPIIDPIITIGYTLFILKGVYQNMTKTVNILMQGVPEHISQKRIEDRVKDLEGVVGMHDVHIWSLEGKTDILTAHVVVEDRLLDQLNSTRKRIKDIMQNHHVEHSTIELESAEFCSGIECS